MILLISLFKNNYQRTVSKNIHGKGKYCAHYKNHTVEFFSTSKLIQTVLQEVHLQHNFLTWAGGGMSRSESGWKGEVLLSLMGIISHHLDINGTADESFSTTSDSKILTSEMSLIAGASEEFQMKKQSWSCPCGHSRHSLVHCIG